MESPVASHSEVQEECQFIVQDSLQQRPGSGIEKYGTIGPRKKKIVAISRAMLWNLTKGSVIRIFVVHVGILRT